jgi:hypothetical protein
MTPTEKQFVAYWEQRRKHWNWITHAKKIFLKIALPLTFLINLVNYFIVGDTSYNFFSFYHLWEIIRNLVVISVFLIMTTGLVDWNLNESRYWRIKRKYMNKLQ